MLRDLDVRALADRHEKARLHAEQIRRPTFDHPDMTIDDAYAAQQAWVDLQIDGGASIVGHKIGLTSRAMQLAMNIDEPDFGTLLDYMVISNGATLAVDRFNDPKLEVELAFILGDRLEGEVAPDDVYAATDRIVPALELIDARSYRVDPDDGATRTVVDTISDNAANAGVLIGDGAVAPGDLDLRWVGAIFERNGTVEETGVAAGVLGDPVLGVVWLARRLAGFGIGLEAGEIVLAGSFTRPVDCRAGDSFLADFGPLGELRCSFE